ncbi:molecular chaperone Prefoldin, subunit 3 [Moesziomyces antarcticus T-34]|uniref:Molecular chaperone Prefoldin, subunit 3 n=1 Tax=Pseudozyma antarctica (strain T-34) TaxID=1151754 RepID=M9LMV2_PSEA3|nr:molecular chaperone Prefoldin, subunit 3 [Moesziomyces antarcticus T-34]
MSSAAAAIAGPSQSKVETNSRGIPHAPFISNVQEYLGGPDEEVEPTLKKFQETMSKYKFMELNTAQRRRGLEEKIPDIRKTLQMVNFLQQKKDDPDSIQTTFELNDTLYAKAQLDPVDTVHLWLGANVMLEYPLEEAISLLSAKLAGAEKSLAASKEDLDFLREQITIMEVNTARVHNWDVKRRRERREELERNGITTDASASKASQASTWLSSDRDASSAGSVALPATALAPESGTENVGKAERGEDTNSTTPEATQQDAVTSERGADVAAVVEQPSIENRKPEEATASDGDGAKPLPASNADTESVRRADGPSGAVHASTGVAGVGSSAVVDRSSLPSSLGVPLSDAASSTALVVPPLNFSMVSRGIYRSGHPNERNFEFLRRLNLKSVMYLGTEDYRSNMTSWTASQGIQTFHLRLAINKEPTAEMDEADVVRALQLILQPANWPMLIHCNKGKYRVGCIVGLLRRLQGWSHTSIFEEYTRFAGTKISDLEFIEVFDLAKVSLQ